MIETGHYVIQDAGLSVITVASKPGDGIDVNDACFGHPPQLPYGTGLLGVGKTKRAIYVCVALLNKDCLSTDEQI